MIRAAPLGRNRGRPFLAPRDLARGPASPSGPSTHWLLPSLASATCCIRLGRPPGVSLQASTVAELSRAFLSDGSFFFFNRSSAFDGVPSPCGSPNKMSLAARLHRVFGSIVYAETDAPLIWQTRHGTSFPVVRQKAAPRFHQRSPRGTPEWRGLSVAV